MNTPFLTRLLIGFSLSLFLASCDDDISDVGSAILTGTNIDVQTEELLPSLSAVSLKKVQTNNLPTQFLGTNVDSILNNKSTYGILARVNGATPNIGNSDPITKIEITSKKLILPFPYDAGTLNNEGIRTYTLESFFINSENLKLEVFNANFTLRDQSLVSNEPQAYYADASDGPNNFLEAIQDEDKKVVDTAIDITAPPTIVSVNETLEETLNAIEIDLDKLDLSTLTSKNDFSVFQGDDSEFVNSIRSIYIKPTSDNKGLYRIPRVTTGTVVPKIQLDFKITTQKEETEETNEISISADYNLSSQFFNIINTEEPATTPTTSTLLKAGAGSIAEISIFDRNKLEELIEKKIIVNNAELIFTVNKTISGNTFLLDQLPALELFNTQTAISIDGRQTNQLGITNAIENDNKEFTYNFNITSTIRAILQSPNLSDAEDLNITLGLGIIDNFSSNRSSLIFNNETRKFANNGTILSLKGVPLFNKNATVDNSNQPKLILKYTATE